MRYLITYEIPTRHPDYPPLIAALRTLRATRVLTATWLVESDRTALDLCRYVTTSGCLSLNERILVVQLDAAGDAAWRRLAVGDAHALVLLGHPDPVEAPAE